MIRSFTLDFWIDDGWYVGKLREVPGVFSQGANLEELKNEHQRRLWSDDRRNNGDSRRKIQLSRTEDGNTLKRRDLIKELTDEGCYLKRHGGRHDIYANPRTICKHQYQDIEKLGKVYVN